jgi:hypothetical protein
MVIAMPTLDKICKVCEDKEVLKFLRKMHDGRRFCFECGTWFDRNMKKVKR